MIYSGYLRDVIYVVDQHRERRLARIIRLAPLSDLVSHALWVIRELPGSARSCLTRVA
jgi:hypothetical protein